jgi:peroxisome-assembly ATPase
MQALRQALRHKPDRWHNLISSRPQYFDASPAEELSGEAAHLTKPTDPFCDVISETSGPAYEYCNLRYNRVLRRDPRQEATVLELQRLYNDISALHPDQLMKARGRRGLGLTLIDAHQPEPQGFWSSIFGGDSNDDSQKPTRKQHVKGLYMHGGVGVGKTFLMDMFANCCPSQFDIRRTHFHDFMLEVHTQLRKHSGSRDPLAAVGDELVKAGTVLCLDEFFVTDVADAVILHRLFNRLWDDGLTLVATSNRAPNTLYEGGLQRQLFIPFIERLKKECIIHDMASPVDYRKLASHRSGIYFVSPSREEDLWERFMELTNRVELKMVEVEVAMGRRLKLQRVGGCIAHFHFDELCGRPLGAACYTAIANAKHSLAVSGIPIFTAATKTEAYRFVTLIDVLYEHKIRLVCSAEGLPFQLFENIKTQAEAKALDAEMVKNNVDLLVDDNLGFAKERTVSRLIEMQSKEYLKAHAKAHAPELLLALEETDKKGGIRQ